MQPCFLEKLGERAKKKLVDNQVNILRHCAQGDIPVVLIEYSVKDPEYYDLDDDEESTVEILLKAIEMVPRKQKVIKRNVNAFTYPYLLSYLKDWEVGGVLLMGVYTTGCVLATAEGAISNGLKIATCGELIADDDRVPLNRLRRHYLCWYRQNSLYFESLQELIRVLGVD